MIPDRAEISSSLFGAWSLLRMDADAMRWFNTSMDGFWRSFFAAVIALPVFIMGTGYDIATSEPAPDLLALVVFGGIAYAAIWVAFPVVAAFVVRAMGYGSTYVPFIVAHNWAGALVAIIFLPIIVLIRIGIIGENFSSLIEFVLFVFTLWFGWLIARVALETTVSLAAALVVLGTVLNYVILVLLFSIL